MENNTIELLHKGEDWKAREILTLKISDILIRSNEGEIAIPEYLKELKEIVKEGEEYLKEFNNN